MEKERQMDHTMYLKLISDTNLVIGARSIFKALWEYANKDWEITLKNKELALLTGYSERSVSRNIRLLAKYGYVIRNTNPEENETLLWKRKITIIKKEL